MRWEVSEVVHSFVCLHTPTTQDVVFGNLSPANSKNCEMASESQKIHVAEAKIPENDIPAQAKTVLNGQDL